MRLPNVIATLDAEWVNGQHAEVSLPSNENRLLSYQLTILNRTTGRHHSVLIEPAGPTRRHRLSLGHLLARALLEAKRAGVIEAYPETLALVAHFSRADLSTLRDWKDLRTRVDSVRRTFTTTSRPLVLTVPLPAGPKRISIIVADTMLLAPAGSSLKALGAALGEEKIELPAGSIARMDLLKTSDPARFRAYALQDPIIAAKWADRAWKLLTEKLGVDGHVPTLGAAGVKMIEKTLAGLNLEFDSHFGYERVRRTRQILECLAEPWPFSANAYHGGRNEAYWVGYSPEGIRLYDLDLVSAYTTAMGMLRVPNWSSARPLTNLPQLAQVAEAMTFARVRFRVPEATRFPSLPCRAGERGLVYPLCGTSWCTGPELVVALAQGAEIQVEAGWRVEWTDADIHPFAAFTGTINRIRADAKASGDQVLDKLVKEVGNNAYGKTAQGVELFRLLPDQGVTAQKGKRVFDSRSESMKTLPPSRITNPMLAATITGVVRAVLSEALALVPADALVMTATTDGILSSVPIEEMDAAGPLARAFKAARGRITPGRDAIWEEKYRVDRVIVTKTRGTISVPPPAGAPAGKPVLARAGFRLDEKPKDPWAECAAWVKVHRDRTYITVVTGRSLIDLRTQWISDSDLIEVPRQTRLNLDFDMKRALIAPGDVEGVLCADTRPWPTVDAFHRTRDDLESWKKSQRRVLKTADDLRDMRSWVAERPAQRAAGSTAQSGRPGLVNAFLRAAAGDTLGLGGWSYRKIAAFVTRCGWPVTVDTIKDAKRRGKLVLGKVRHLTAEEERFALIVFFVKPGCELDRFAAEGSPAHEALERRREEANVPAYDDDHIPDEVASGDWPLDEDGPWAAAGATPPYSASAALPCQSSFEVG